VSTALLLALLALGVWVYLAGAHGRFWSSRPQLAPRVPTETPAVDVIVPARDEAATIAPVIASLLAQDYCGEFRVILVDDGSTDGTAALAGSASRLAILRGEAKPAGWSGKLWALSQGIRAGDAPLLLLTDADIMHDPRHLAALVAGLQAQRLGMVSEMVHLNCSSFAERALIPAFVYFFQMLYPFRRVNDARSAVAAAAGGTILIRRDVLAAAGGIEAIKGALIDDVALARVIKPLAPIYLGHSGLAASIRPYPRFADIGNMISRTAFTQLRYSVAALFATVVGLFLVWILPIATAILGSGWEAGIGLAAYLLAISTYLPTLRRYGRSPLWAFSLPVIALFYIAATCDSAWNHWRGVGARWKNRAYESGNR
jgi:hopene-associated glycosyltransferase HpnB